MLDVDGAKQLTVIVCICLAYTEQFQNSGAPALLALLATL